MSKMCPGNTRMKTSGKEALKTGPGRRSHHLKIEAGTKSHLLIAVCIPTREPAVTNMENICEGTIVISMLPTISMPNLGREKSLVPGPEIMCASTVMRISQMHPLPKRQKTLTRAALVDFLYASQATSTLQG